MISCTCRWLDFKGYIHVRGMYVIVQLTCTMMPQPRHWGVFPCLNHYTLLCSWGVFSYTLGCMRSTWVCTSCFSFVVWLHHSTSMHIVCTCVHVLYTTKISQEKNFTKGSCFVLAQKFAKFNFANSLRPSSIEKCLAAALIHVCSSTCLFLS